VVLVLFVVVTVLGPTAPLVANPPGIQTPVVGLELAATPDDVFGIVGPDGHPGRPAAVAAMRLVTRADFAFLLAYASLYAGIVALLGARTAAPAWLGPVGWALAATMACADAAENVQILRLLDTVDAAAMAPTLAALRRFTLVKWNAIFAASALVAPWMWRSGVGGRWSGAAFALGAVCGFAWVVHLPAIEWSMAPVGVAWATTWIWALAVARRARAG
jgi:hypothetical protein